MSVKIELLLPSGNPMDFQGTKIVLVCVCSFISQNILRERGKERKKKKYDLMFVCVYVLWFVLGFTLFFMYVSTYGRTYACTHIRL